jgi:cell division protein FtsZ
LVKPEIPFFAESFFRAKIKVIGIGGGGGSIVSEIGRSLNKATFVIADTDIRAFKKRSGIKYFLFGRDLTHGLGTGVNPDLGRMAAEQEKEKIAQFFKDQDIVIFIASLGGGVGSGSTQVFVDAAKDFNGITFGIFTLPFKFEGRNKYKIAYKALRELRKSLNVSITIPNEKIFKIIKADTAITDAFSTVNKNLIESLESLIDLIYNPGIINIDFADLKAILSGKGNLAFLNTAEASGKARAEDIAQKILYNPLYQNSNFTTEKILFNIAGGRNLGMFEVDRISRAISELNPKAKIIFGISKNAKYKNKIKTTLLMAGTSAEAKTESEKLKKQKNILKEKTIAKITKIKKNIKKKKKNIIDNKTKDVDGQKIPFIDVLQPVFNDKVSAEFGFKKLSIIEAPLKYKKTIRRTALDIKKAEEDEENKQSVQEKEWEIPAFLRKVKFK